MTKFLLLFYLLTGAVWLARSWRAFEALRQNPEVHPTSDSFPDWPLVSILLPVKNEEINVAACLENLLQQNYPAKEIIVINDHSVDRTREILSRYVSAHRKAIRVINASRTPPGWTGKNWALAEGVRLAKGKWFLFTDADTRHEPWSLTSAMAHALAREIDLLTLSPRCLTEAFWEKTLQPAAMAFTGLWFPFYRVNNPSSPLSFGNGQYLLIRKEAYQQIGGHEKVREAYLEDFGLVREAKKAGFKVECAIGTKIFGTRMYRSLGGIWAGWRRIFLHAFEKNPLRLLAKAVLVFSFSVLPFVFFLFSENPTLALLILGLILLTLWKTHAVLGAPRRHAFLHPMAGLVLTGILADAAWAAFLKKELKWR